MTLPVHAAAVHDNRVVVFFTLDEELSQTKTTPLVGVFIETRACEQENVIEVVPFHGGAVPAGLSSV